jgi:HEPN domain-containing protein
MKDETRQWLAYAEENLAIARLALQGDYFNACLHNVQQAVEKSLKALVIEQGLTFQKTHSIAELTRLLASGSMPVDLSDDACELLDAIYLPSKYPAGSALPDFHPDRAVCEQCLRLADRVRVSVKRGLPE